MVSQYRKKKHIFCCCKNHGFLGTRAFSKSTAYMGFYSKKKDVCQISNYRADCDVELIFWNVGVKIRRNCPTFVLSGHPGPTIFGPLFGWKKCQSCDRGDLKRLKKRSKIDLFGHLMHFIASLSPGLWYIIQL